MFNESPPDLLDELLAPLRLEGVFASRWEVRAPWGFRGDQERNAILHYVRSGECAITLPGASEPVPLRAGELAIFPRGAAHELADRPGRATTPLELVLPGRPAGSTTTLRVAGPGRATDLLCGGLHYDEAAASPLYRSLPEIIVLDRGALAAEPLLSGTLEGLIERHRGLAALRAFELVFVLALRAALDRLDGMPPALRDPAVGRALLAIQTRYAEPWTLESLAREARMSRSAFAAAFTRLVGEPPARHLAGRRMREAVRLLTGTDTPLAAIPERVGYRSAVGFHLAFRRHFGAPPGEYRRASRRRPGT
ncbi:AraC family transcriptional regulator [Actinomadura sp. 6K520]|uniref:AraC family transcriptional regulator n=1 Tax=Actinomadura sp. 6K520 TaxID=2530364 RepID=UPI0010459B3B|nr:AraC family transcriptional regulator [Actinomadura sp. 6K520]TDE19588.1 AraC family transcriptional regulator [Actinomadura sp. 6K520]